MPGLEKALLKTVQSKSTMRGSRKFCQRGSNFDKFCFVMFLFVFVCFVFVVFLGGGGAGRGGRDDPSKYHYKRAIIGPPAKRHLNGFSLACR